VDLVQAVEEALDPEYLQSPCVAPSGKLFHLPQIPVSPIKPIPPS